MTTACTGSAGLCEINIHAPYSRCNFDWQHLTNSNFCVSADAEYLVLLVCTHSSRQSKVNHLQMLLLPGAAAGAFNMKAARQVQAL